MQNLDAYIKTHEERFLNELFDLLRIPSVSADPKFDADVRRCAEEVKKRLVEAGLDKVEIC
ncbi:MAG TPA: peptidase dimerization domain protein, partial [Flavobacteriales bacterium]|nr:peptidase dimerization domain protein [Flavobacteriales bacterium]